LEGVRVGVLLGDRVELTSPAYLLPNPDISVCGRTPTFSEKIFSAYQYIVCARATPTPTPTRVVRPRARPRDSYSRASSLWRARVWGRVAGDFVDRQSPPARQGTGRPPQGVRRLARARKGRQVKVGARPRRFNTMQPHECSPPSKRFPAKGFKGRPSPGQCGQAYGTSGGKEPANRRHPVMGCEMPENSSTLPRPRKRERRIAIAIYTAATGNIK
jgi:hypothetical protein